MTHCARCRTELPPDALACPACRALLYSTALKQLAADAEAATRAGDLDRARGHWTQALQLLPPDAEQHAIVRRRLTSLAPGQAETRTDETATSSGRKPRWKRTAAGLATAGVVFLSKIKFLLLGLTKASTFVSMFAFFGVYWSIYGWPLALGLVLAIYIHEMGHVAMLRRLGIESGAPMFIPGVGALVMLKQHITDPTTDATIGLAGPVWGLGAAVGAMGVYALTRSPTWLALAQLTAFLNLFNLTPVWQLDGSRGIHALSSGERWMLVAVIVVALLLTEQRLLLVVGGVAVWRALQKETGPGNPRVLTTFIVLVIALSWLARGVR